MVLLPAVRLTAHVSVCPGERIVPAFTPAMSRLCNSVPVFLITNWMQPAGTDVLSRSNAYSRRPTLTVDGGVVHEPPPPVVLVVPPVVVPPVVVPDVVVDATTATPNVPF